MDILIMAIVVFAQEKLSIPHVMAKLVETRRSNHLKVVMMVMQSMGMAVLQPV